MSKEKKEIESTEDIQEEVQKTADDIAKMVMEKLGIEKIVSRLDEQEQKAKDAGAVKVFVAKDVQKDVAELSTKEKFHAFVRAMFSNDQTTMKALSEGVSADGGYTVPQDFYPQLLEEMMLSSIMRPLVNVVQMTRNVLTLSIIDHGPEVYWTSEGASKTTTTADFSQPTITAYKLAAIIYLTDELIDDSAFDLTQVLVARFAKKLVEYEDRALTAGSGTGQPTGVFTANTVATRACSGNLDFDDIIDLFYDLPLQFRNTKCVWMVHPTNVKELRKIKDTTNRYIWQDAIAPGQPATIMGYRVIENPYAPESQILFGDLSEAYWMGERQLMTVKITNDSETTFTQDKTAIRVVRRFGGTVVMPNAVRKLITIP